MVSLPSSLAQGKPTVASMTSYDSSGRFYNVLILKLKFYLSVEMKLECIEMPSNNIVTIELGLDNTITCVHSLTFVNIFKVCS